MGGRSVEALGGLMLEKIRPMLKDGAWREVRGVEEGGCSSLP